MRRNIAILAIACLFISPIAALQFEQSDSGYGSGIIDPTLTLDGPNGGESWTALTTQYVNWSSVGSLGSVKLEYSDDGFSSDINIIVASTTNDGSYLWTVANDPSATITVRVSFVNDTSINDVSNASFTITAPQTGGLLHWWKLDESSGSTAYDSEAEADGTLTSMGNEDWVSSVLNNGLTFDGNDDVVTVSDQSTLDLTDALTLSTWVKPAATGGIEGGDIGSSILDSLEYDTANGYDPAIIHISGNIYAIVYKGSGNDGFVKTVEIATDGTITNSVIDTLEYNTAKGAHPDILHISGNVYAIAHQGAGSDGFIKTVEIASNGQITNSVIDTLEFDNVLCSFPDLTHVSGNYYAVVYQGVDADGFVKTVEIATDGTISNSVIDSLEYNTAKGNRPQILGVGGEYFAIAHQGSGADGFIKTVNIDSSGNIAGSVVDTLEFDTGNTYEPSFLPISDNIYAVAYRDSATDGKVKTVEIASNGQITSSIIDTLEFDTSDGYEPSLVHVNDDIYAVAYRGVGLDGFVKTIEIADNGQITNSVVDTYEYNNGDAYTPALYHVSGDVFAIAYRDYDLDGQLKTLTITQGGSSYMVAKEAAYGLELSGTTASAFVNGETVTTGLTLDTWTHLILTYDRNAGGTEEVKLYKDGVEVDAADYSTTIATNANDLLLGQLYQGDLDEIRLYDEALSASEVTDLYNGYFTLTLTAPDGGESWTYETSQDITWTSTGLIDDVKLEYSTDGFSSDINTIVASTTDDGTYSWTVPEDASATVTVRVSNVDTPAASDTSDADFTILVPDSLTLTAPNGGESWAIDSSQDITWSSTGSISNVKLEYSKDSFNSDINTIVASTSNDGAYSWTVPDDASASVKVRVSDASTPATNDVSDATFTIPSDSVLRHWWRFDESSGSTAYDSEGDTDGTLYDDTEFIAGGKLNNTVYLDGYDDVIKVSDDDSLDVGADDSVSFAFWFTDEDNDEDQYLFYKASGSAVYMMEVEYDGDLVFYIEDTQGDSKYSYHSAVNYDDGDWYHVVGVINRTSDMMYLYVDGQLKDSDSISSVGSLANSGHLYLGARNIYGDNDLDGKLDEFRFYDVALTAGEVQRLYSGYTSVGGNLRHWWKFDETSGTNAEDSIGNEDGTMTNGAYFTGGYVDRAAGFDGNNDVVVIDDDDSLDVDDDESVSIALWFRADDDDENQYLFFKEGSQDSKYYLKLESDGDLKFYLRDVNDDSKESKAQGHDYDDGAWYHIVCVIDRDSDTMYLYIDGDLKDSDSISGRDSLANDGDLHIGAKNSGGSDEFDGLIDDFRFYDEALDADAVDALYDSY